MNNWNRCKARAERIAKSHNFSVSMESGNARYGVRYKITFTSAGKGFSHKLRSLSPSALFDELSAFDWGLSMARFVYEPLKDSEVNELKEEYA